MSDYPKRCELFALHYAKWLFASGAAHEAGPDATALVLAVVMLEDEFGCQRPVKFFNEQLMDRCGVKSEHSLIRARKIAIGAGLLQYEPGRKRQAGRYFVSGFTAENAAKAKRKSSESEVKASPSTPSNKKRIFIAPKIDKVREYWTQENLSGNPEKFFDHFQANGWTQGRQAKPLKDWKAAARNWSRNAIEFGQAKPDVSNRPEYKPFPSNGGAA